MNNAREEFKSYVVEKRRQYGDCGYSVGDIADVVQFLLRDFGFQSRVHLFRLFKVCCLNFGVPSSSPPTIDLSGCAIGASTVLKVFVVSAVLVTRRIVVLGESKLRVVQTRVGPRVLLVRVRISHPSNQRIPRLLPDHLVVWVLQGRRKLKTSQSHKKTTILMSYMR